ncbi:MAG: hypothetical protein MJA31_02355 [Clostridia bacterium]|nr:hypothetical protein [Clostridia bacterium]
MLKRIRDSIKNEKGMEMVQVAILIAIAIGVGIIFKDSIGSFIKDIFDQLNADSFEVN